MNTLSDIYKLMDSHDELYLPESKMASLDDVENAAKKLGVTFGSQLRELLLSKIVAIGSGIVSDYKEIVEETKREWSSYPFTKGYVFFLSQDEWHMFVDSDDNVYLVEVGGNKIEPQKKKLFDWIYDTAEEWYSL